MEINSAVKSSFQPQQGTIEIELLGRLGLAA